jgi:hypothetical protein
MVSAIFFIVTDQLFGVFFFAENIIINKISKSLCMWSMLEMEIQTLPMVLFFDINNLFSSIML